MRIIKRTQRARTVTETLAPLEVALDGGEPHNFLSIAAPTLTGKVVIWLTKDEAQALTTELSRNAARIWRP